MSDISLYVSYSLCAIVSRVGGMGGRLSVAGTKDPIGQQHTPSHTGGKTTTPRTQKHKTRRHNKHNRIQTQTQNTKYPTGQHLKPSEPRYNHHNNGIMVWCGMYSMMTGMIIIIILWWYYWCLELMSPHQKSLSHRHTFPNPFYQQESCQKYKSLPPLGKNHNSAEEFNKYIQNIWQIYSELLSWIQTTIDVIFYFYLKFVN